MTVAPATAGLAAIRPDLLRFAQLQLRDHAQAEDVVQDALLAACGDAASYDGRSSLKTWVFGILKHKIIDLLRQQGRTTNVSSLADEGASLDEAFEALFGANAHWSAGGRPRAWADPAQALEDTRFWEVFEACLTHLPEATARVFMMREFLEFETGEVCATLDLSVSNCHVILHRARNALRRCLENTWFSSESPPC